MSLSQLIKSSVQRAKTEAGDLLIDFTVRKKTGTRYFNGVNTATYVDKVVKGMHDRFEESEIDGNLVKVTDDRIVLFIDTADQVPTFEDLLLEVAEQYQVIRCQPIYAGLEIVLALVHARK